MHSLHRMHRVADLTYFARRYRGMRWEKGVAPDDSGCRSQMKMPCYSPAEMRNAYNINLLTNAGFTGSGQSIVIIDSYGSPTVAKDLKQFDHDYNLPDPPSFQVRSPLGTVPFDVNNSDIVGWAQETDMDVEWAHAMAPGANIVLLTSPISETQGVQGMPEFLALEQYALDNNLGNIISQSWGTTEETLFTPAGKKVMEGFNRFYKLAASRGVTVLASVGDTGVVNPDVNGNNYKFPTVEFPASSPYVTSIGGTSLFADTHGTYQSETAWNDGVGSATGGGFSHYFKAPSYQAAALAPYAKVSKGNRGVPDIAYNGDPTTSIPIYLGFMSSPGYYLFGGTSAGSPQLAGLIAIADQIAGHSLGFINPELYQIAASGIAFHDITTGNNNQGSIIGYRAGKGWDPVTGWGTPRATFLIAALISAYTPSDTIIGANLAAIASNARSSGGYSARHLAHPMHNYI
ncbi:serine protease [Ktedonobacteria bacterium brp13]|nr:serine protease [Ktedonobacteria bacterium brp13]